MSLSGSKGVVAVWKIESSNRPKCPIENHRESGTLEGYRPELNRAGFEPDSDLRDNEDVPLTAETARGDNVDAVNEAYFHKEVSPHVPDAWIDKDKIDWDKDTKRGDKQVGVVGYEIPFNRHFYEYEPPRPLAEIDAELDELSGKIMEMLQEVHS